MGVQIYSIPNSLLVHFISIDRLTADKKQTINDWISATKCDIIIFQIQIDFLKIIISGCPRIIAILDERRCFWNKSFSSVLDGDTSNTTLYASINLPRKQHKKRRSTIRSASSTTSHHRGRKLQRFSTEPNFDKC